MTRTVIIDAADIEALETAAYELVRSHRSGSPVTESVIRRWALALRFRAETGMHAPA